MVEKLIKFYIFKTSTPELDCGWSRNVSSQSERSTIMYYDKNNLTNITLRGGGEVRGWATSVSMLYDAMRFEAQVKRANRNGIPVISILFTWFDFKEFTKDANLIGAALTNENVSQVISIAGSYDYLPIDKREICYFRHEGKHIEEILFQLEERGF